MMKKTKNIRVEGHYLANARMTPKLCTKTSTK